MGRTYEEKLAEAGMVTLEERRRRGDLIQVYRTMNGVDNVDPGIWFSMAEERDGAMATRQARGFMNVQGSHWTRGEGNLEIRKNFWSQRVAEQWNSLPSEVKAAESLNTFKNGIDNVMFGANRGQR